MEASIRDRLTRLLRGFTKTNKGVVWQNRTIIAQIAISTSKQALNSTQKHTTVAVFSKVSRMVTGVTTNDENNSCFGPSELTNEYTGADVAEYQTDFIDWQIEREEERLREAYQMRLLHGINASSMARVKNDVMEFEDYEWEI